MRKRLHTLIALLMTLTSAWAQNVVTLDSCRNMAIRNNKAIKIADATIEGAGYAKKAAAAAYLPGVDFTGAYTYNQHKIELLGEDAKLPTMTFDPLTGKYIYNVLVDPLNMEPILDPKTGTPIPLEVAVIPKEAMSYDTHNVFVGAVTLTQPVYMGGQIRAMNEITKYAEKLAQSMRNSAIQNLVFTVDEAYWQVVSLESKRRLAESFVGLVDTLRLNVDAMVREGVATRADALRVDVKLNEAKLALTKVENGVSLSRMALAQLCGLPIDSNLQPADAEPCADGTVAPMVSYNMEDVYESRPDLESMRHGISISEHTADLTKADMLPKVAIIGAYTFSNPNVNHGFEKRFGGGFSIGATLTVPLWHWGLNYNKYRAAKAETNVQRLALAEAEEKVELQVNQAKFKYDEAYKTYATTLTNLRSADENLRCARLGFKEGVLTLEDVLAAQTAWVAAHSEMIDARIGVQLCGVYLNKVLGRMDYGN